MQFTQFGFTENLTQNLTTLGFDEPTKIQSLTIPHIMEGKNVLGQSQTGSGKTAAFLLPIINGINPKYHGVQALIIAPTRELAMQIREDVFKLTENMGIRSIAVYGKSNIQRQKLALKRGVQIVVGTPGRLLDLINRKFLRLDSIKKVVLDEVDRMLDMGFFDDVDDILSSIPSFQMLAFSATVDRSVKSLIDKYTDGNIEHIKIESDLLGTKLNHGFMFVDKDKRYDMLTSILNKNKEKRIIIFAQTKQNTKWLFDNLDIDGYNCGMINGDMQQRSRNETIAKMKDGKINILVATDVASRGLNLNDINLVVNYDVPQDPEDYVHRIGRTARAGEKGSAVMLVSKDQVKFLKNIERANKFKINKLSHL